MGVKRDIQWKMCVWPNNQLELLLTQCPCGSRIQTRHFKDNITAISCQRQV